MRSQGPSVLCSYWVEQTESCLLLLQYSYENRVDCSTNNNHIISWCKCHDLY